MKTHKKAIFFLLFFTTLCSYGQQNGNVRFSFQTDYLSYNHYDIQSYGLSWEIFIGRHFALDYHYAMGRNNFGGTCYYFPGSVAVIVMLYGEEAFYDPYFFEDNAELMLLTFFIPEGISYHSYPRKWLELAPYFYPFSSNYNFSGYKLSSIMFSLGFKIHIKPLPNFSISPSYGMQIKYNTGQTSQNIGLAIGWLF